MPAFRKPSFQFDYDVHREIDALRHYRDTKPGRQIPAKADNRLLVATWNISNLGLQKRREDDYRLLAEVISWFDIIALQEVNDDLSGLDGIRQHLPESYSALISDKAGNEERAAFLHDTPKVSQLEMVAEIAVPPSEHRFIRLPGIAQAFAGFDRNPFLGTFVAGDFQFALVNVHLYFGDDGQADRERRALEAFAVSRWADLRHDDKHAYVRSIIPLGDFNLPIVAPGDLIYEALRKRGLVRPPHSTRIASNIADDKDYDQILFLPGPTEDAFTGNVGVFDFDGGVFADLWQARTPIQFRAFLRYYMSDHRPLWSEFRTD